MEKKDYKDIGLAIGALLLLSSIVFGVYYFFFAEKEEVNKVVDITKVEGFGKTPEEALAKFIKLDGNMGDTSEVTSGKLLNGSAASNNAQRRLAAYNEVKSGLVTGSEMLDLNKESYIKDYSATLPWAEYFIIDDDSIKVGNVSEPYKTTINDIEYTSVDVYADFQSTKVYYRLKAQDSSSDGTYMKIENSENFTNVKFTLVEVDTDAWRIYSCDDNEEIGSRFATWDTESENNYDVTNDVAKDEIKPDNK